MSIHKVIEMKVADRILDALRAAGSRGLLFEELTDTLAIDTSEIQTTMEQLISEGQVMQKQDLEQTRYILRGQVTSEEHTRLSDLNGCPCFHCLKISRCGARQPDSPLSCKSLEEWILGANTSS